MRFPTVPFRLRSITFHEGLVFDKVNRKQTILIKVASRIDPARACRG